MDLISTWFEQDKKENNSFVRANLKPLGRSSWDGKIVVLPESFKSDSKLVAGTPGSGKTVLAKNIFFQEIQYFGKKGIVFDAEGQDHHLNQFPNPRPINIFQQHNKETIMRPKGIEEYKCFTPVFANIGEYQPYEEKVGVFPADLTTEEWEELGGNHYLAKLCHENPGFDVHKLYEWVSKELPTTKKDLADSKYDYTFNPLTVEKMKRVLDGLMEKRDVEGRIIKRGFFASNEEQRITSKKLKKWIKDYQVLNFSFYRNRRYARVMASSILRRVYYLRQIGEIPPMTLLVEEADKLAPRGGSELFAGQLNDCIRRGRKFSWNTHIITQHIDSLNDDTSQFCRWKFIGGSITSKDLQTMRKLTNKEIVDKIKKLKFNPAMGIREFIMIYPDNKHYRLFYPFNCPVKTYEEEKYDPRYEEWQKK